jgi:hypothetical protein
MDGALLNLCSPENPHHYFQTDYIAKNARETNNEVSRAFCYQSGVSDTGQFLADLLSRRGCRQSAGSGLPDPLIHPSAD